MKFIHLASLLALTSFAQAGHQVADKNPVTSPFDKGGMELQIGTGAYFSLNNHGDKRPTLNDADLNIRLGWMLTSPSGNGALRGNYEFLLEAFGAAIFDGPGDSMEGLTMLLRYNFVHPGSQWVPYVQIGGGGLFNDAYKEHPQRLLGQSFEFNLQTSFGLRYMASDRLTWFLEAGYRHISNADSAARNLGLNSLGALVGASWFF